MTMATTRFDITEYLDSEEAIAAYLDAVLEEGDAAELRDAIGHVARARGMTEIAARAGMSRQGLYKALGETGNPSVGTLMGVLKALGVRLSARAA
jgi:probable addiction module antidote protein